MLGTNGQFLEGVKPPEILNFAHEDDRLKNSFEKPPL
jgi:hypothetical protein